jgi:F-type H+-transporting ATPase subunit delta
MSSNSVVAKRYAKALFEVAQEKNIVEAVETELKAVVAALQADENFAKFIVHPNIASADKLAVLNKAFGKSVSETVLNTLSILVNTGRESIIEDLLENYVSIANALTGSASAIVTSPSALSEKELAAVAKEFGKAIGKSVRAENVVNPALLGGFTIQVGDRLYDASLSGKLARLEKSLITNL